MIDSDKRKSPFNFFGNDRLDTTAAIHYTKGHELTSPLHELDIRQGRITFYSPGRCFDSLFGLRLDFGILGFANRKVYDFDKARTKARRWGFGSENCFLRVTTLMICLLDNSREPCTNTDMN